MRLRAMQQSPADLLAEPKAPDEMRYAELGRYIDALKRSGNDANKLVVEQALKLALPATCLIIALFGAPLAVTSPRAGAAVGLPSAWARRWSSCCSSRSPKRWVPAGSSILSWRRGFPMSCSCSQALSSWPASEPEGSGAAGQRGSGAAGQRGSGGSERRQRGGQRGRM